MNNEHDPKPTRTSTVDAADNLRKEWKENGTGPYAVPEGVATAVPFPPMPKYVCKHYMLGEMFDRMAMHQYAMRYANFVGAQQREAGRREAEVPNPIECLREAMDKVNVPSLARAELVGHFSNAWNKRLPAPVAALATSQPVSAQLDTMRSAFHQNMLRAFPEKSHAEIDAEITRATGVAGPVSTLTDEQRNTIQRIVDRLNEDGMPNTADELCALLAASPKVAVGEPSQAEKITCGNCKGAIGGCSDCSGTGFHWEPVEPVSDDKRDAELSKLRSEMAYIAAYSLEELQMLSRDRLLMRADAIIQRAQRAITATPPQPKPETK